MRSPHKKVAIHLQESNVMFSIKIVSEYGILKLPELRIRNVSKSHVRFPNYLDMLS